MRNVRLDLITLGLSALLVSAAAGQDSISSAPGKTEGRVALQDSRPQPSRLALAPSAQVSKGMDPDGKGAQGAAAQGRATSADQETGHEWSRSDCVTCHAETARFYAESPHFESEKQTGEPGCIPCHGNRCETVPQPKLLQKTCLDCHGKEDQIARKVTQQIDYILKETDRACENLRRASKGEIGSYSAEERALLTHEYDHVKSYRSRVRQLAHSLDVSRMQAMLTTIERKVRASVIVAGDSEGGHGGFSDTIVGLILAAVALLLISISGAGAWLVARVFRKPARVNVQSAAKSFRGKEA